MEQQFAYDYDKEADNVSCPLLKLFVKGHLGKYPQAQNRLQAGFRFMRDYRISELTAKTTRNYDRLFVIDGGKGGSSDGLRCDATDRYLRALKFIGCYRVYAHHFLRDEQNVKAFLARYPVLNQGSRRTYKMVYQAVNNMLDKLALFYENEKR